MKYLLYFNNDDRVIVEAPHNDVDAALSEAVRLGAGITAPLPAFVDEYMREFDISSIEQIDWTDFQLFLSDYDFLMYDDLVLDIYDLAWEPMPPNARVGIVSKGSEPTFNRLGVGRV